MATSLFDQTYLTKLSRLQLLARRLLRSRSAGEHLALGRGASLEFQEYRRYYPGDDFRLIDWNVFGRTERLFLKLFSPEHDLNVYLLLDTSASMDYGRPPKIRLARQIAGSLGYLALSQQDRLSLFALDRDLRELMRGQRSRNQAFPFFQVLSSVTCAGAGRFNEAITRFQRKRLPRGLVVVISDLLEPEGCDTGLKYLAASRHDVLVVQVLDRGEVDVATGGPRILEDVEGHGEAPVTLTPALRQAYARRMEDYLNGVEAICRRQQIEYLRTFSDAPFEDVVLRYLRRGALVH